MKQTPCERIWLVNPQQFMGVDYSFQTVATLVLLYDCTPSTLTKLLEKKSKCKSHKHAASYFEQILEASPYKTAAVQPLTSHHTIHLSKACWGLLKKLGRNHNQRSSMNTWIHQCWPSPIGWGEGCRIHSLHLC